MRPASAGFFVGDPSFDSGKSSVWVKGGERLYCIAVNMYGAAHDISEYTMLNAAGCLHILPEHAIL